jgi:hypothetical protein
MPKTLVFVLCALGVCAPSVSHAQTYESVGIRAQGMAGAFVAVADDATASWWNPAGLATSQSFADGIVEVGRGGHWGIAFGFPSLGLSYYHLNISQIAPSGSTGAGGTSRQDLGAVGLGLPVSESAGFDQFGATVGQSIGDHFVVGTTVKVIRVQSETRGDFDLGAMAAFGRIRAGLNVRNLVSGSFGSAAGAFELTRQARAGVAVTAPTHGTVEQLTVSLDVDLTAAPVDGRDERHVAAGAEAWMLGHRIAVRGGVGANVIGDDRGGDAQGAFGAVGFSASPFQRVYVDGAAMWGPTADRDRWGVDLRVTF